MFLTHRQTDRQTDTFVAKTFYYNGKAKPQEQTLTEKSNQRSCTYSLCGISSSWSPTTLPLSANKIVIKNPNKILWSIAFHCFIILPLISSGTLRSVYFLCVYVCMYLGLSLSNYTEGIFYYSQLGLIFSCSSKIIFLNFFSLSLTYLLMKKTTNIDIFNRLWKISQGIRNFRLKKLFSRWQSRGNKVSNERLTTFKVIYYSKMG